MSQQQTLIECARCNKPGYRYIGKYNGNEFTWTRHYNEPPVKVVNGKEYYRLCLCNKIYTFEDNAPLPGQIEKPELLAPLVISIDGERIELIDRSCISCHKTKTKMDYGIRPHWYTSDEGFLCKNCYERKRIERSKNKMDLRRCVDCGGNKTYINKNGCPHWYRSRNNNGYICHKCYQKVHAAIIRTRNPIIHRASKPIPMINRVCVNCNNTKTYIRNNGSLFWHNFGGRYLCHNCYLKLNDYTNRLKTGKLGLVGINNVKIFLDLMDKIIRER